MQSKSAALRLLPFALVVIGTLGAGLVAQQAWLPADQQPTMAQATSPAFDDVRQVAMIFDGATGYTHEWNGTAWRRVAMTGPTPTSDARLAFDRLRGRMVLWLTMRAETWEWSGTAWSQIATNTPTARTNPAFVFDLLTQRLLAHGGFVGGSVPSPETWIFDGTAWTLLSTTGPAVSGAAVAFEPLRGTTMLVGGATIGSPIPFPTPTTGMWEWNGAFWTMLTAVAPVAAPVWAVHDNARQRFLLVSSGAQTVQTWQWSGASWQLVSGSSAPFFGNVRGLAFDSARNLVLAAIPDSTWSWNGAVWQVLDELPIDANRPRMVTDTVRRRLVMVNLSSSRTWEWDGAWRALASGAPADLLEPMLAFDGRRGRTVLFGGVTLPSLQPVNGTWEWNGANWTQAAPPVSPTARKNAGFAFDAARQNVVLFGGLGGSTVLADTWTWDGAVWVQRTPATSPSARERHAMAYDPRRQRVVVYGGVQFGANRTDTWEWDGATWSQRATNGLASSSSSIMAYDPNLGRIVLLDFQAWEWDGASWSQPDTSQLVLRDTTIAFDPRRGRMLAFGFSPTSAHAATLELFDDSVGQPCHSLANGGARLELNNASPALSSTVSATLTAPAASTFAIFVLGSDLNAPAVDLTPVGVGCSLHARPDAAEWLPVSGGTAQWSRTLPASPVLLGLRLAMQAFTDSPAVGLTATNAVVFVVGR